MHKAYNPNPKPCSAGVVSEDEGLRRTPDPAKFRRLRPAFAAVGGWNAPTRGGDSTLSCYL